MAKKTIINGLSQSLHHPNKVQVQKRQDFFKSKLGDLILLWRFWKALQLYRSANYDWKSTSRYINFCGS